MERKYEKYYQKQIELSKKVICHDQLPATIRYIAGTDVSYNDSINMMVGAFVVLDAKTLDVVETAYHEMEITFPYITGLFSFREIPPLLKAFEKLEHKPDLIVCDGQGIAHPRQFGMACHLGVKLDIPTIGCGKTRLTGSYDPNKLGALRGASQDLVLKGEVVGKVLRTRDNKKPVFVSLGHKISLETSVDWILKLTPKYKLPETTRQADRLVGELMRKRINN